MDDQMRPQDDPLEIYPEPWRVVVDIGLLDANGSLIADLTPQQLCRVFGRINECLKLGAEAARTPEVKRNSTRLAKRRDPTDEDWELLKRIFQGNP